MVKIDSEALAEKIAEEYVQINRKTDRRSMRWVYEIRPVNSMQQMVIDSITKNMTCAAKNNVPLCQDTGTPVVFISLPENTCIDGSIFSKTDKAIKSKTIMGLRSSMRSNPFSGQIVHNSPDMHILETKSKKPFFVLMAKGGGSENLTEIRMLMPDADINEISGIIIDTVRKAGAKGCPPYILGIGIGGNADQSLLNSKMAVTGKYPCNRTKEEKAIAEAVMNAEYKIGIQGLGFGPTVTDCRVISGTTHIASMPLSISFQCYQNRVSKRYI